MNKPLLTLVFIIQMTGSLACFAQGRAAILLNNHDSNHPIFYGTIGNPAAGGDFYVQILGGPDANHLQPVAGQAGFPNIFHIGMTIDGLADIPGFFDYGMGIVPDVIAFTVATFQVRAWTGAPTFETASARVPSPLFVQETGYDYPVTLPAPAQLHAFPADLVIPAIPEPAILMLCFVGIVVFFSARWRISGFPVRNERRSNRVGRYFLLRQQRRVRVRKTDGSGQFGYGDFTGLDYYGGTLHFGWADNSNSTGDNPDTRAGGGANF